MPDIAHAIGRGIVGAGRAIRGSVQGGARQATPTPPPLHVDETVEVRGTDETQSPKRNLMQRFGSKIKRDATNAPFARGVRAIRDAKRRRTTARSTR